MTTSAYDNICLKIGVTAHRDLSQVDEASLERQVREFFTSLQAAFPDLPLSLMCSLAPGGDLLVARVALDMGLPLEVPLPMPLHLYEADFDCADLLAQFRQMCAAATLIELPLLPGTCDAEVGKPGPARDLQYAQMGMYLAGHSHLLLTLWDGEKSTAIGGTASVVHYQLNDEMIGLSEPRDTEHLLAEKESDLVYHIHCPRSATTTVRESGRWVSHSAIFPGVDLPERFRAAFEHMQEFRRDIKTHRAEIEEDGGSLLTDEAMFGDPALANIDTIYRASDWLAIHYRKLVLRELKLTHSLAALMGISFVVYSEYMEFSFLLPTFLLCFFVAWLLNGFANRFQWHRKYLDHRALAEGLRVQFYWTLADAEGFAGTAFDYDNLMQKQDVELVWIRHVMRGVSSAGRINLHKIDGGLELAIARWVGDDVAEEGISGQLGYYRSASRSRAKKIRTNTFYGQVSLWLGISIAVALLLVGNSLDDLAMNILLILMGLLPLFAGIREAYAFKKADKELTKQYQFMHKTFSRARDKLGSAPDREYKKKVLRALGEACLEEHSEWILIHRERPLESAGLQA